MQPYSLKFLPRARRQLENLPRHDQQRISARVDALPNTPRPHDSRKLVGEENTYRIRVGDYRVLYEIRESELLILIVAIGPREHVYRRR